MPPFCWLSVRSPQRRDFSLTQRPFLLSHFLGLLREMFPLSFHQAAARFKDLPQSEKKKCTVCLSGGLSVCLALTGVPDAAAEQRGKAEGVFLRLYSLVKMCVIGCCCCCCCWTGVDCSLHPLVGNQRICWSVTKTSLHNLTKWLKMTNWWIYSLLSLWPLISVWTLQV